MPTEIEPGFNPEVRHLRGGRGPDTVKLPDRKGLDEFRPHVGSDDEEPVRLAMVRGELSKELVVGHAGRSCELDFGADPGADFLGDLCRRWVPLEIFGDVEIRLIEG